MSFSSPDPPEPQGPPPEPDEPRLTIGDKRKKRKRKKSKGTLDPRRGLDSLQIGLNVPSSSRNSRSGGSSSGLSLPRR